MDPTPANPSRLQTSILSAAEKRLLIWMAGRLPAAVGSDHLTVLALAAMILAGMSYWVASRHPVGLVFATLCLAVNWFGDSLDGTVARVRQMQRPRYGFYVDHVVDAIGTVALLGGLGVSGYMSPGVAALLLLAYMLVSLETYLATSVLGTFRMSFLKVGPTELRILLAVGNTWVIFHPAVRLAGHDWLLFDVGAVIGAAGLVAAFLVSAARNTYALYLAEPLPRAPDPAPRPGSPENLLAEPPCSCVSSASTWSARWAWRCSSARCRCSCPAWACITSRPRPLRSSCPCCTTSCGTSGGRGGTGMQEAECKMQSAGHNLPNAECKTAERKMQAHGAEGTVQNARGAGRRLGAAVEEAGGVSRRQRAGIDARQPGPDAGLRLLVRPPLHRRQPRNHRRDGPLQLPAR